MTDTGGIVECSEYVDIGPFRFECGGHHRGHLERAVAYLGGKVTHYCSSPQEVGDVDVTFWTQENMANWTVIAGVAIRRDAEQSGRIEP